MSRRIAELTTRELEDLVRSRELDEHAVLEVLRNPYCTVDVALAVADERRWLRSTTVRERLAGFRGMPAGRSMDLLATLPWLSLLLIAQTPRTPPVVRRQAEKRLLNRLHQMTLGEKVALARRSHRPLFPSLIQSGDARILGAMLDNPRMVENDVLVMLSRRQTPPDLVQEVARHRKWGARYRVRRGIAESGSAPLPVAISALVHLRASDLQRVMQRPGVGAGVRDAARALLEKERRGERRVVRSAGDGHRGASPEHTPGVR